MKEELEKIAEITFTQFMNRHSWFADVGIELRNIIGFIDYQQLAEPNSVKFRKLRNLMAIFVLLYAVAAPCKLLPNVRARHIKILANIIFNVRFTRFFDFSAVFLLQF